MLLPVTGKGTRVSHFVPEHPTPFPIEQHISLLLKEVESGSSIEWVIETKTRPNRIQHYPSLN